MKEHPIQEIVMVDGVERFRQNAIVRTLLDHGSRTGLDLNQISVMKFDDEDRRQLAQLIGGSLQYYVDSPFVRHEHIDAVRAMQQLGLDHRDAQIAALQDEVKSMREVFKQVRDLASEETGEY